METSNIIHVAVISDEDGEVYIFTSGRGKLRVNQNTAKWLYSWLGRNLTPRAADAAIEV